MSKVHNDTREATEAPSATVEMHRKRRRSGEHRQSAEVRERILNATLEVAREHGYRGLTIARVSKASGMPSGSVYWHFASKDLLLKSAMDLSFERHRVALLSMAPRDDEQPHEYIDRIMAQISESKVPWEFWRIGVALIADEVAAEVETQARFLSIRKEVIGMFTHWWARLLPESVTAEIGRRPEDFAHMFLHIQDGLSLALAAREDLIERMPAFVLALRAVADLDR